MVEALLHDDVLTAVSQPIVDLTAGKIVSHELLTRGPSGPLHQPDQLFRYCAERDILTAVDLRSLKQCAAAATRLVNVERYHVNIMPATLLETPVAELIGVLSGDRHTAQCCLEISEQQLLGEVSCLREKVAELRRANVAVAIDDVGFGSSCLEGLLCLEPALLKIDKRLVCGVSSAPEQRNDLERLLRVADVLRAEVVAEGIEHADDLAVLIELGVRYGQGFLFGRPRLCAA
jgi:EAL domain-containing protein (putative c-di-GMP-specific phosphodiesterase class I)